MKTAIRRPTIEGLPSPASSAPNAPKTPVAPAFRLDLRRSLRMHPYLALGAGVLVLLAILGIALRRKPMYSAETLVYIDPISSKMLSDGSGGGFDPSRYDSYVQQQMQTAVRPDILASAIAAVPAGTWRQPGESGQSAVDRLGNALKIKRVGSSYQLSISLEMAGAQEVAAMVNAVTQAYLAQGSRDENAISGQRLQLLAEERQRVQAELDQDRSEAAQLGAQLGLANPVGDGGNAYDVQLEGLRTQLAEARQQHDVAAAQLASVSGSAGAGSPGLTAAAEEAIANDSGLSSLKSAINTRKAALSSQMAGLTPTNPVYKQDQDEIAALDRSEEGMAADLRDRAARRLQDRLRLELQRTGDVESRLNGQLAHQTATATGATPKLQRSAELAADIQRLTLRYAAVDDAIRGIKLETSGPGLVHLSVPATVPSAPDPSKRSLMFLLALPLAMLAGAGAAVLANKRDKHVYTGHDVEEVLGFLPIGLLPARAEVSEGVLEEYGLRLAAGLANAFRMSNARSFVLTAASPEIVTKSLAALLQTRLEELGFRSCVTSGRDLLRPVRPMDASGTSSEDSGELLLLGAAAHEGYAGMHLERLLATCDVLLIDAAPLLHSAETEYLVRCADATLLVAECGVTERSELYQAAVLLERLNVAGVGAVLQELHLRVAEPAFQRAIGLLESRQSAHPAERVSAQRPAARKVDPPVAPVESAPEVSLPSAKNLPTSLTPESSQVELTSAVQALEPVPQDDLREAPAATSGSEQEHPVPDVILSEMPQVETPQRTWLERLLSQHGEHSVSIQPGELKIAEPLVPAADFSSVEGAQDLPPLTPGQTLVSDPPAEHADEASDAPAHFDSVPEPALADAVAALPATSVVSQTDESRVQEVVLSSETVMVSAAELSAEPVAPTAEPDVLDDEPALPASQPEQGPEPVRRFARVMSLQPLASAVEAKPFHPPASEVRELDRAPEPLAVSAASSGLRPVTPFTTGRWESALTPRLVTPTTQDGPRRAESSRETPIQSTFPEPLGPVPLPSQPFAKAENPPQSGPNPLTRPWKLLSRFGPTAAASDEGETAPQATASGGSKSYRIVR